MKIKLQQTIKNAAFSFPEVLFAVMILGIGLIMVASMFPVGIKLSQQSVENVTVDSVGRAAVEIVHASRDLDMVATPGTVLEVPPLVPATIESSRIWASDPRYAWIALYKWDGVAGSTKFVTVIITRSRKNEAYDSTNLQYDLKCKPIPAVKFINNAGATPDTVEINSAAANYQYVAQDGFIVISNYVTDPTVNGQIYRLGALVGKDVPAVGTDTWELALGRDLQQSAYTVKPTNVAGADVLVVGKQLVNPTNNLSGVEGPDQDLAVYESQYAAP